MSGSQLILRTCPAMIFSHLCAMGYKQDKAGAPSSSLPSFPHCHHSPVLLLTHSLSPHSLSSNKSRHYTRFNKCKTIRNVYCLCSAKEEFVIPCKGYLPCPPDGSLIMMGCFDCMKSRFKEDEVTEYCKFFFS